MASTQKKRENKPYQRFKYSEEDMEQALEAIQKGDSLSAAAATYNIPKSTLHNRYTCKVADHRKMGPTSVLTKAEEDRLEKWIIGKAQVGFPMHPDEVKDAVQRVIEEIPRENPFTNNRPGKKWMDLFLTRHPEIRKKHTDMISKARACVTEDGLRQWFADVRAFLKDSNNLDILDRPGSIFNGDETGVQTCPKSGLMLGPKSEKNFYEIANGKEKECITVLCTFSASGESLPPMIVFPYKRIPLHIAQSVPDEWPIGRSDSGWMVHTTFYEYVRNSFYKWCVEHEIQFPVLFFLDGHKSHISSELREFCVEKEIILYCLPPNSTHMMQPCDVTIFKPLKAHWKRVVNEHKQQTQKPISKTNFAPLFKKAFDRISINVETIQKGFKTCGLYPFDENAVNYSKCISTRRANLRQELEESSISREDYASAKKVIEHVIGTEKTESFANIRSGVCGKAVNDPLFPLWKICADKVEGMRTLNAEEKDADEIIQQNVAADVATLQDIGASVLFPVEESIDTISGLPIYNIVLDQFDEEEKEFMNETYTLISGENPNKLTPIDSIVFDTELTQKNLEDTHVIISDNDSGHMQIINTNEAWEGMDNDQMDEILDENRNNLEKYAEKNVENVVTGDALHEENNNCGSIHHNGNSDLDGDVMVKNDRAGSITRPTNDSLSEKDIDSTQKNGNPLEKSAASYSQKSLDEVWKKHLKWPEFERKEKKATDGVQKKAQKKDLPYAITSMEWKNYYESVQQEQEEKKRKAAERIAMQKIKKESDEAAKAEKAKAKLERDKAKAEKAKERAEKAKERAEKARVKNKEKMRREKTGKPRTRQRTTNKNITKSDSEDTGTD